MRRYLAPPARGDLRPGAEPTFSVVIAVYQAADVVGEALESLRRQTLAPHEVIVCDDGSTDAIDRALDPYRDEIVLIRKENGGEASAKNAAAARASGDYVAILDADDVYEPGRLAALAELARERPDLDILTTDAVLVADGVPVRRNYDASWRFEVADQRRAILRGNFIFGHAAVRRSRFAEHGGFDESIRWTTDWDLWLRMILAGSLAGCVDEPLAQYRLRETSLTAQRRDLVRGKLQTLEKAGSNPHLRPDERPVLEQALRSYRLDLALLELRAALAAGDRSARRRAAGLARAHGLTVRRRIDAAAAAVSPALARYVVRRQEARGWTGAGGTRVARRRGEA
jgi:glycosyltransferase involved in cell wall biosynthesis